MLIFAEENNKKKERLWGYSSAIPGEYLHDMSCIRKIFKRTGKRSSCPFPSLLSCRRSLLFCYNMISANVLIISDLRKCWGIIPWKMVPEKGIIPWKQALYWGIIPCFWCVFWGIIPFFRCLMPVVCYPLWLDRTRRLNACQRRSLSLRFVTSSSVCWFLLCIDIMSLGISVGLPIVGWGLIW